MDRKPYQLPTRIGGKILHSSRAIHQSIKSNSLSLRSAEKSDNEYDVANEHPKNKSNLNVILSKIKLGIAVKEETLVNDDVNEYS